MKNLILLALMMVGISASAQWSTIESVDEFGDVTGEVRNVIHLKGAFANSATTGDRATGLIEKTEDIVGIATRNYGGTRNTYYKDYVTVLVKKADGTKFSDTKYVSSGSWVIFNKPTDKSRKKSTKPFMYDIMLNLTYGDKIVVKEGSTKSLFTIDE